MQAKCNEMKVLAKATTDPLLEIGSKVVMVVVVIVMFVLSTHPRTDREKNRWPSTIWCLICCDDGPQLRLQVAVAMPLPRHEEEEKRPSRPFFPFIQVGLLPDSDAGSVDHKIITCLASWIMKRVTLNGDQAYTAKKQSDTMGKIAIALAKHNDESCSWFF